MKTTIRCPQLRNYRGLLAATLAGSSLLYFCASSVQAVTKTWNNSSGGAWNFVNNWSPAGVPGASDDVIIGTTNGAYTVTIDSPGATFRTLTVGGGDGLTKTISWVGSTITGSLTLNTNAILNLAGPSGGYLSIAGVITNNGTINWKSGGPSLLDFANGTLENRPGGVVDLQTDGTLGFFNSGTTGAVNNAGLLRKSGGVTASVFAAGVGFANAAGGLVDVQAAALQFPAGFTSASTFNVGAGAAIQLTGGTFNLGGGHTFTGAGYYGIPSGSPFINGPLINTNFQLGGTMIISNQLTGVLQWTGGVVSGALTVANGGVVNLAGPSGGYLSIAGVITNNGTINWKSGGPSLLDFANGTLENRPGGVVDLQTDGTLGFFNSGTTGAVNNAGLLRKSGGLNNSTFISPLAFNNSGTIQAYSGALVFNAGYTTTAGTFTFGIGSSGFGRINVTGNAPLAGSLGAVLLNGFVPATNTTFQVMNFGSSSGGFSDTTGLRVGSGRVFQPQLTASSLTLLTLATNDVTITNQPQSATILVGSNAVFSVGATGTGPLGYQWRYNGNPLGTATNSSYAVNGAQLVNAGNYDVIVSSSGGSATSAVAVLTVYLPPGFSVGPVNQTVRTGGGVTFGVTATGFPPPSYQWLLNGVAIPGATGSTYTVTNAAMSSAGQYSVVVSNAAGSATNLASLALVDLKFFAGVVVDGPLGGIYRIDYTTDVNTPSTNWTTLATIVLTNQPQIYFDPDSADARRRFYRAVPQP